MDKNVEIKNDIKNENENEKVKEIINKKVNDHLIENNNINNKKPDFYVLIYNIGKSKNLGTLIRSASAFNCKKILVLGSNKKILKSFFGSQGTVKKMDFVFFETIEELKKYCNDNTITICGIEIGGKSEAIHRHKFQGNTLFVLGNEGSGMNDKQKKLCDEFVYIPQYSDKTGSLNVAIAASIIFHHYAIWADYKESEFKEEKYCVNVNYEGKEGNDKLVLNDGCDKDDCLEEMNEELNKIDI